MAHKSAVGAVLAGQIPVKPSKGGQPMYYRSKHSIQVSSKLIKHQTCVGDAMRGKKFADRAAVKEEFTKVTKACKKG